MAYDQTIPAVPDVEDVRRALQREMSFLRERFHVETLGVFGSYVRGEQTEASDVDLLVTFSETPGLFAFVALADHLEAVLGRKVDLVTRDGLERRKRLAFYVLREVEPV